MKIKRILEVLLIMTLVAVFTAGVLTGTAASDDPADSYVRQTAPNEDSSINLWFDYSFKKTFTSDKTSTGMDTFSIYMAKNETESAQFVLYSDTDKTGMSATVTEFSDGKGNTVPAEIYYEMYVTTDSLDTTSVLGSTTNTTFIRAGETPDPVAPLSKVKTFKLNGGKSQAFLIRAKSASDTAPGWYSAQLNIMNSDKQVVKTATVYCYVWDFEISEKTELKTAFYLDNNVAYGGSYQAFYDYLLENRLCAMDVPGGKTTSTNAYLTNPRVSAARVTSNGGGNVKSYMDSTGSYYSNYPGIYGDLVSSPIWDQIKDKLYFYTCDEPMSLEQQSAVAAVNGTSVVGATVDTVKGASAVLDLYFPGGRAVVPYHENHPYPYGYYTKDPSLYADYEKKDATQEFMDSESIRIWCPQLYAFTPQSELKAYGYEGYYWDKIRDLSNIISGMYNAPGITTTPMGAFGGRYYNWAELYGEFDDRINSYIANQNANGGNYELWTYSAGWNKGYSYCNHLVENTGLQTKLLFWQLYQNDCTGYLYYGSNNWDEYDPGGLYTDRTVTGAKTNATWKTNRHNYAANGPEPAHSIFGNGTLFYGYSMGKISGLSCVGSLRVEILRDGVEEYQMLTMLEDLKGNTAAKSIVGEISNNVVNYISMPNYDRSAWASSMNDYAVMETVRRQLGNEIEAATVAGKCDHEWDDGTVTTAPGCLTEGCMTYTCMNCDAVKTEVIPSKHTVGDTFTKISGNAATCTVDGSEVYQCSECGYKKTVTTLHFHGNEDYYKYESKNDGAHNTICTVCGEVVTIQNHVLITVNKAPTCTEEGIEGTYCARCDYEKDLIRTPANGHTFVEGVCTVCGEPEPEPEYMVGDLNSDKEITAIDSNLLKKAVAGTLTLGETEKKAADVSGDGEVTAIDANLMTKFVAGAISVFPATAK